MYVQILFVLANLLQSQMVPLAKDKSTLLVVFS